MTTQEALNLYMGLFEEIFDNDPDSMEDQNFDDYIEVVKEFNTISDKPYNSSYIRKIKDLKNELPY